MMNNNGQNNFKLAVESLYHHCDLSKVSFNTTADLEDSYEHLGQKRAMDALKFGIGIKHDGYNLYVQGSTGLGKNTTVKKLLAKEASTAETPPDWCYINNFSQHHKPLILELPAGQGHQLQLDMLQLIEDLLVAIPAAFESDEYRTRAQAIQEEYKQKEMMAFKKISDSADEKNIALLRTPGGYTLGPMKDGRVITPDEFDKLDEKEKEEIKRVIAEIEKELIETIHKVPDWYKENRDKTKQLNREISEVVVNQSIAELAAKYAELPDVLSYVETVKQDIINNVNDFRKFGAEMQAGENNHQMILSAFTRYQVNVLVDNSQTNGAPVIFEDNPTYLNLIGRVEHIAQYGTLLTDFTLIKSGALHRANGGYLVLDARKVLMSPFSWEGLKRAIHAHEVVIEGLEKMLSLASTTSLQPEPVSINVKVVLTGSRLLYYLLKQYDPEFGLLFKVAADFAEDIERNEENSELYARLVAGLQKENELAPFNKNAVQRIIEHCSRLVEDSEKLSLHMGGLLDLLREGDYWARQENRAEISEHDIQKAIDTRRNRLDQIHQRVHEQVLRGDYLLDTSGEKVAQINGLSVIQLGDYSFGRPSRITATARLGQGKVIDIEREAKLGGAIHSKGVLILSSYLANRYAKDQPISLSASLVFEQSYGYVEGDSASAAELCALLSALSDVAIKQNFSVTGSVNQYGEIQTIGGVNEKIEGFFDICNARGLTGDQGVIIPHTNVKHLMLREDIRGAVEQNKFAVYSVKTIDQMMQLLTGKDAGVKDVNGNYPQGTVNYLVQRRVEQLNKLHKTFSDDSKIHKRDFTRKNELKSK
ncbi:MAG: AAA family ATPase [Gammaproteobacteria bacterium]|nr:AAA family ATPase [Gammaproteobacteria bacterium]